MIKSALIIIYMDIWTGTRRFHYKYQGIKGIQAKNYYK
jgi:hypothetical protein